MLIRQLTSRDPLADLELELAREANRPDSPIDIVNMSGAADAIFLAAEVADEIVGAATMDAFVDAECELHKIYVLPAHRRSGVGTLLVDAVVRETRARGVMEMNVKVTGGTGAFWRRCLGEVEIEQVPDVGFVVTISQ